MIPLSRSYKKWIRSFSKDPLQLALSGGEDYELLFTAPPQMRNRIFSLVHAHKIPITRIGEVLPKEEGFLIARKDGKDYSPIRLGFEHFK
jgi:thiamine-monophosphate kinase